MADAYPDGPITTDADCTSPPPGYTVEPLARQGWIAREPSTVAVAFGQPDRRSAMSAAWAHYRRTWGHPPAPEAGADA